LPTDFAVPAISLGPDIANSARLDSVAEPFVVRRSQACPADLVRKSLPRCQPAPAQRAEDAKVIIDAAL
jgi:hypothetical protein